MSEKRVYRLDETMHRTGYKRSSIYAGMKNGTFPQSIPLGPRAVGWLSTEINAWIDARINARRPKT